MDPVLVGVITFFALLIGGLILYSNRQTRSGFSGYTASDSFLDTAQSPDTIVRLQLDELLAAKGIALEDGQGAFEYVWTVKDKYEALKAKGDAPGVISEQKDADGKVVGRVLTVSEAGKSQQLLMMERAIELARFLFLFETRVAIVQNEYEGAAPSQATVMFLNSTAAMLRAETTAVQAEADRLMPGFGRTIVQDAMLLMNIGTQWAAKEKYAALKASIGGDSEAPEATPAAASVQSDAEAKAGSSDAVNPQLQRALMDRAMELARHIFNFENRMSNMRTVPAPPATATLWNAAGVKLREETAAVQAEANRIRPGFGQRIMQDAMKIGVELERAKQMRQQAEAKEKAEKEAAAKAEVEAKRAAEEKRRAEAQAKAEEKRKEKEAERAYKQLDKELSSKKAKGSQK